LRSSIIKKYLFLKNHNLKMQKEIEVNNKEITNNKREKESVPGGPWPIKHRSGAGGRGGVR
jgi:hypothetical protein